MISFLGKYVLYFYTILKAALVYKYILSALNSVILELIWEKDTNPIVNVMPFEASQLYCNTAPAHQAPRYRFSDAGCGMRRLIVHLA